MRFKLSNALFVDEHHEIARVSEVDLRGKQSRRLDAVVLFSCKIGEGDRKQGPADTITDSVSLLLAGDRLDSVEGGDHALTHVFFEAFFREPGVRIDPRNYEYCNALVNAPLDEGFLRRKVEDIKLVDPRWNDQEWQFQHALRRCFILDELH